MKIKPYLTILLAIFCLNINAQVTFLKTYNKRSALSLIQKGSGYFLTGLWGATPPFSGSLIKLNSLGDTLWTKETPIFCSVIIPTLDGGFRTSVSKFDSFSNLMWDNLYFIPSGPYGSGFFLDGSEKIIQTKDSGYAFLHPTGMCPGPACGTHYAVLKTDKKGNAVWFKDYGNNSLTTALSEGFTPKNIMQTLDNNLLICGSYFTQSDSSSGNGHLLKLNQNGDTLWSKAYNFDTISYLNGKTEFYQTLPTQDSGFIVLGNGVGNDSLFGTIVCKINSLGNPLWAKRYLVNSWAMDYPKITKTSDGGYAITGDSYDLSVTEDNVGLIKINSNGDTLWTKTYGTIASAERGNDIIETADGHLAIAGDINYTTGFLLVVDSLGNGCNQQHTNTTVTNITLTVTHPTIFAYPLIITDSIFSDTLNSIPVIKTDICSVTTAINEQENISSNTILVFPNPFSTQTTLETDNLLHNATLTVYNCFGQTVKQIKNISGRTVVLSRDNLASGMYFVRLTEESKIIAADKLVISDK